MENMALKAFKESIRAKEKFFIKTNVQRLAKCAELVSTAFTSGHKLMIAGNGGSAADAQHVAAEFVNRFMIERPPLPAIALTTDSSILTSVGNDYDFSLSFSKQVAALGKEGDVLLAISTSGGSQNVIKAAEDAKKKGITVIALTGKDGGKLAKKADIVLNVPVESTPRIQETHILVLHILCEQIDHLLFKKG